jgi:hypothetical protein
MAFIAPVMAWMAANAGTIAAVSAVAGAAGSVMQGNAQAASYNQQAAASERNARVADMQARQAYDAGLQNELTQRRQNDAQQAQVRAAVTESGFDPASGSALEIQGQSARDMEMDALSTRYSALLQGWGHEQQAASDRYTAQTLRKSAKNARRQGYIGAATSALSSLAGYGIGKALPLAGAQGVNLNTPYTGTMAPY